MPDVNDYQFGTTDAYFRAFQALQREGIPDKHIELLQAHFNAPGHTATWAQLAAEVGYANGNAVNLQYGTLAGRVANLLGVTRRPQGFWIYVLGDRPKDKDKQRDTESGHARFVLRRPVIEALTRLGIVPKRQRPAGTTAHDPEEAP